MSNIKLLNSCIQKLEKTVNYNPKLNSPAVTVLDKGDDIFQVLALCYIPKQDLTAKSKKQFKDGKYSGYEPSEAFVLQGSEDSCTIALAYFENITNVDLTQRSSVNFTSRSFAVCYDIAVHASYECDLCLLDFTYQVTGDQADKEVVFLAQGDLDPILSRGTVDNGATPPRP